MADEADPSADEKRLVEFWIKDAAHKPPDTHAWSLFVASLRLSAYRESKGERDTRLPDGMDAVAGTVAAVITLLEAHDFAREERLHIPSVRLAMAITDVSEGRRASLFEPVYTGTSRKKAVQANVAAIAARALSELVEGKESLDLASQKVSRAIKVGKLAGYSTCTKEKVKNWRARLEEGEGGSTNIALARYRAPLPKRAGKTAIERAEFLLKVLRTSAALRY